MSSNYVFSEKGFEEELGVQIQEDGLSSAEEMLRNELLQKYTDDDWNIERKNILTDRDHEDKRLGGRRHSQTKRIFCAGY